jgi:hypothetical protein
MDAPEKIEKLFNFVHENEDLREKSSESYEFSVEWCYSIQESGQKCVVLYTVHNFRFPLKVGISFKG